MPRPPKTDELILGELLDQGLDLDAALVKLDELIAVSSSGGGASAVLPLADWRLVPAENGEERYVDVAKFVDILVEETAAGPPALYLVDAVLGDGAKIALARDVERPAVDVILDELRVG